MSTDAFIWPKLACADTMAVGASNSEILVGSASNHLRTCSENKPSLDAMLSVSSAKDFSDDPATSWSKELPSDPAPDTPELINALVSCNL